jgi:hypothetical protein
MIPPGRAPSAVQPCTLLFLRDHLYCSACVHTSCFSISSHAYIRVHMYALTKTFLSAWHLGCCLLSALGNIKLLLSMRMLMNIVALAISVLAHCSCSACMYVRMPPLLLPRVFSRHVETSYVYIYTYIHTYVYITHIDFMTSEVAQDGPILFRVIKKNMIMM